MSEKNNKSSYSPNKSGPEKGGFKNFLWNSETGQFLGRTASSWFKITVFYLIFYAGLAIYFGLMLWIFYQTLDPNKPRWEGDDGIIGSNPGVGFRPMPDQDKNVESTLIWYKRSDEKDRKFWYDQLEEFVDVYEKADSSGSQVVECYGGKNRAGKDKACKVDTQKFGPCQKQNAFGYDKGEPCILIKLNKIYGWEPERIDPDKDRELYDKMPIDLKTYIEGRANNTEDYVWISCEGENPADKENIGPIGYFPEPGIPSFYFPFMRQIGYQTPFIFVQFTSPLAGVLINIECKAWAKNIIPDRQFRLGSVHFELMVD